MIYVGFRDTNRPEGCGWLSDHAAKLLENVTNRSIKYETGQRLPDSAFENTVNISFRVPPGLRLSIREDLVNLTGFQLLVGKDSGLMHYVSAELVRFEL